MSTTAVLRDDVELQLSYDRRRNIGWPVFEARYQAVLEAQDAELMGEVGARYALRQALIDLQSCCEHLCLGLARPVRPY